MASVGKATVHIELTGGTYVRRGSMLDSRRNRDESRHCCVLPSDAQVGSIWRCFSCGRRWQYRTDNVASAGWSRYRWVWPR